MKKHHALIGFLIVALWPVWRWYGLRMTDGSDEPWGIIALVVGLGFLWRERHEIRASRSGVITSLGVLLVYAVTFPFCPPLIRAVLGLLAIGCLTGSLFRLPAVWGLVLLSLPIIASLQFYVGYPMRVFAAAMAKTLLSVLGIGVQRVGTDLYHHGDKVGVDPACSGIEMLWVGLFLILCWGAWMKWGLARTILGLATTTVVVVVANGLRVTLLYFKESGRVDLPEWTHEGVGLLVFAVLVFVLTKLPVKVQEEQRNGVAYQWGRKSFSAFAILFLVLGFCPMVGSRAVESADVVFPGFPDQWQGCYLEEMTLTESEVAFAKQFPGEIGVFTTGPDKIIMRWVTQPTRKLHSSADCLRAAGFEIETERAGVFVVTSEQGVFLVEEKISGDDQSWREVSSWFWAATLRRTQGPWIATTRISPLQQW
ncbi:MAG: archaeosortase/exosortase family protein [Verrucomicrobiota bacterium]